MGIQCGLSNLWELPFPMRKNKVGRPECSPPPPLRYWHILGIVLMMVTRSRVGCDNNGERVIRIVG